MSLSDKVEELKKAIKIGYGDGAGLYLGNIYHIEDLIRQFIKELKARDTISKHITINDIDELAGEGLI